MGRKMVSLRLDEELLLWADEYARQRGVSRTDLLETGLRSFQDDCSRGVPELRRMARNQSSVIHAKPEQGVGDCPDRPGKLGHVWAGIRPENGGGPSNPCKFCGTSGREFFREATGERVELFSKLRTPASIKGGKK